jgi:15-O-acetyltransferase Tri3
LTQYIKRIICANATITHLGHAAMVIAMLRSNPPLANSNTLYSPCWLNGRRYLISSPNQPSPIKSFIPICLSFAPVVFTGLHELVLGQKATKKDIKGTLVKACRISTNEYLKIKERKSLLPENLAWMEEVGEQMWK